MEHHKYDEMSREDLIHILKKYENERRQRQQELSDIIYDNHNHEMLNLNSLTSAI